MMYLKVGPAYIIITDIDSLDFKEKEYIYNIEIVDKNCVSERCFNKLSFEEFKIYYKKDYKNIVRNYIEGENVCYYREIVENKNILTIYIEFEGSIKVINYDIVHFHFIDSETYNKTRIFKIVDKICNFDKNNPYFKFIKIKNFVYKLKLISVDNDLQFLKKNSIYDVIELDDDYEGDYKLIKDPSDLLYAFSKSVRYNFKRFEYIFDNKLYMFIYMKPSEYVNVFLDNRLEKYSIAALKGMYSSGNFNVIPEEILEQFLLEVAI